MGILRTKIKNHDIICKVTSLLHKLRIRFNEVICHFPNKKRSLAKYNKT